MSRQTPLFQSHLNLGAKIVDFSGWDMPLHYGSQLEEHHAVRQAAGLFDVSHMLVIDLKGENVKPFLLSLLANNVEKLDKQYKHDGTQKALYTCMLNAEGGVIDDLIVYFLAPDVYRIVVNAGTAEKDLAWITKHAQQFKSVSVEPRRDLAILAVQGPLARAKVWEAFPAWHAVSNVLKPFYAAHYTEQSTEQSDTQSDSIMIARTGYTGEDGFELILPQTQAQSVWDRLIAVGVHPIGLGARDTLRLEAGMNLYGQDMDETTSPLESGLGWTIDFSNNRDFIGRAALETHPPQRQLIGLVLEDRGVLRAHQSVFTPYGKGETSSGGFSPSTGKSIAFARVPNKIQLGDILEVEIREKRLKARVVHPPFVNKL